VRLRAAAFLLLILLFPVLAAALDVPPLQGRVNDHANIIPPDARQRIEQKLAALEQRTGAQIAVLTIPSLEGDSLEDFSLRVAEAWKLGQAGKDNGALLLVAQQDRKMRVEVGYGLEPVLTDLETSLIQRDYIVPRFRNGDFGGGIEAGVDALVQAVEGEVEPVSEPQPVGGQGRRGGGGLGFFLFALFFLGPFSLNAARSGSWLVSLFLLPFYFFLGSMISFPVGLAAAGLWLVAIPILRMLFPRRAGWGRRGGGGGWFIGPGFGGGGGRGGWGGGGGGFSGGGGSFGGGGSSSSW
jgi:uncharacterized protein